MKNPMSVIMECLTNKKWGHGVDPASIDREAFEKLDWTPINIPKINHAEELQKMREHIAANPDGDCDLEHFNATISKNLRRNPDMLTLKVKKLHPDARLPVYGTDGAACFDLAALDSVSITAHGSAVIRTGLAFEIPEGHVMMIFSRSGHGFKNNIRLANCVGILDADYRGEVMLKLTSDLSPFQVEPGDRIAQAMVIPFPRVAFEEVEELSPTERGEGGFGSTGSK